MGSGNTKVRKINRNESKTRHSKAPEQRVDAGVSAQAEVNFKSSPCSGRSDNNNNGKEKFKKEEIKSNEDWLGPGMIADDARHGVTAEALLIGKKRLKPTLQSNNNCNKELNDKESEFHKHPHPKPRLLRNILIYETGQAHGNGNRTNTMVTQSTSMRISTRVQQSSECTKSEDIRTPLSNQVDRLTKEVYGREDCVFKDPMVSRFTFHMLPNRQPLPAPRLSKSRAAKKILGQQSNSLRKECIYDKTHFEKSRIETSKFDDKKVKTATEYDDYDLNLMAEIEREFGDNFG